MEHARDETISALEELAAALGERGYQTVLADPHGRSPHLLVTNPRARQLSEAVMAAGGWYWWPWADRIAPTSQVSEGADRVAKVLATVPEPAHG